jgi:hypothetical protein
MGSSRGSSRRPLQRRTSWRSSQHLRPFSMGRHPAEAVVVPIVFDHVLGAGVPCRFDRVRAISIRPRAGASVRRSFTCFPISVRGVAASPGARREEMDRSSSRASGVLGRHPFARRSSERSGRQCRRSGLGGSRFRGFRADSRPNSVRTFGHLRENSLRTGTGNF